MPEHDKTVPTSLPPFTDGDQAKPHYTDTIDPSLVKPTPGPTPPGDEPTAPGSYKEPENVTPKSKDLDHYRADGTEEDLTSNLGVKIADNQNTLKAGVRGPSILSDFHFLEKMAHFDQERIPERVVHARGSGAHGFFQVYRSMADLTKAAFLRDPDEKTPVFVRFSNVQGFRGSPDTVRDIRGFATKFYTQEGNFDLVGNNTPVFFLQDAIKFPDFIHALKPEPHDEVPQGQSAHDSFWDYISLQPETLHNVMWNMSDRAIPRSFRTMEGFGIHSYRLINAEGKSCFVRFHWKPVYGKCSLVWDESQLLTGRDPDFLRKDLWQAIEAGDYPEFELGLQIIPEEDVDKFDFDILDATKLIPEALVPVQIVGKMTLDRNPDNFFAETEQAAFCPANIVPGIDFSNDPLLQGRVFSYSDTQRHRLGTANFTELPINKPVCPYHNHQRDGFQRMRIDVSPVNYEPNSLGDNWPRETPPAPEGGGFSSFPTKLDGVQERRRSASFADYYSHPRLFWLSQTEPEQRHIIDAFSFELGKVARPYIRERVVDLLTRIDSELASAVAHNLGIHLSADQKSRPMPKPVNGLPKDPSLSLYAKDKHVVKGKRVSVLVADGVSGASVEAICATLSQAGIHPMLIAPHSGHVETAEGRQLKIDGTLEGNPSVLFDAVAVAEGPASLDTLAADGNAQYHLRQAYKHLKSICVPGDARRMLEASRLPEAGHDAGLVTAPDSAAGARALIEAMKAHRVWAREQKLASFCA